MNHALVKLTRAIDWCFLKETFGAVYTDRPGQPPLPTRLMAGLAILKHTYDLSDETLGDRWVENPYFQYLCGEEHNHSQAPNPRRVRIFAAEKRIELPLEEVDILAGQSRTAEFLAKNSSGGVPVLELDDGSYLSESVAICRYLEGLHPEPNLLGRDLSDTSSPPLTQAMLVSYPSLTACTAQPHSALA
jgi:hypothetical protein